MNHNLKRCLNNSNSIKMTTLTAKYKNAYINYLSKSRESVEVYKLFKKYEIVVGQNFK